MKKLVAALAALAMVLSISPPATASAWAFPSTASIPDGSTLVAINEPNVGDAWSSWYSWQDVGSSGKTHLCPEGASGTNCDPTKSTVHAVSLLSPCTAPAEVGCIESLRARVSSSSDWVQAEFSRGVEGQGYSADNQRAVPAGQISLWKIPGVSHAAGDNTFAVMVKLRQIFNQRTQQFEAVGLTANVSPFLTRPGGAAPRFFEGDLNGQNRIFTEHDPDCIWADSRGCGLLQDFAEGTSIELQLRVPNTITGWFKGRLQQPQISILPGTNQTNQIRVSGLAVSVPRVSIQATREGTPAGIAKVIAETGGKNPTREIFTGQSIRDFYADEGERVFEVLDGLRAAVADSSQGLSTLWNFTTVDSNVNQPCFANKSEVLGIVTTNATAYRGDPPAFDKGYLSYKVAGMHHAADGKTLNLGTYDLIINSSVARCLYGFSSAPVQASIQVVSDQGEATVATTQVSETDGWLKLAAYGFTFSEKDIQIKLTQFKPKTITLSKFAGKAVRLNAGQSIAVESLAGQADGAVKAVCTGIFLRASERTIALARAKESCRVLQGAKPALEVAVGVKQTKLLASNFKVTIGLK